jgi:hypothetical protein
MLLQEVAMILQKKSQLPFLEGPLQSLLGINLSELEVYNEKCPDQKAMP